MKKRFAVHPPAQFLILLTVLIALMVPFSVQAQPAQEVIFFQLNYLSGSNEIVGGALQFVSLTDGSIRVEPLPQTLFIGGSTVTEARISPDRRFLAVNSQPISGELANPVAIYNLETDSCCVYVQPPTQAPIAIYELGEFSPDSGQLALSWLASDDLGAYPFIGGIITVDAASGQIIRMISDQEIGEALGQEFPQPWAQLGTWRANGLRFAPNCYACEGVFEGEWSILEPATFAITPASGEYFSYNFGAILETTGETLYAAQDLQFPASAEPAMFPIPNVILYIASGRPPMYFEPPNAPAIYFNESQIDAGILAEWVLDGQAALISAPGTRDLTLLFRDGTQQDVLMSSSFNFLTGTPNGWLMLEDNVNGRVLTLYTVEGAEVLATPLGEPLGMDSALRVLDAPELGTSLTSPAPFPAIAPRFPPVSDTGTCPNLLATRLAPYSSARVTPGDPNRLRSDPTTDGAIIGEIPGGETFYVLGGPICDDASGVVWWQVDFNGLIGWTAESLGDTYFVEPVG